MPPLPLDAAAPPLHTAPAVQRHGHPNARGFVVTLSSARDQISALSSESAWRPSDPELERLVAVPDRLGAGIVELRQGDTPELGLVATGGWSRATVYRAITDVVVDTARDAWDDALTRLPPGPIARVEATVDLRQDKLGVTMFATLATTPPQRQTAQVQSLAAHIGLDDRDAAWLCGAHELLTRQRPYDVLVGLTLAGDGLRPWVILRYRGAPTAAARGFRESLGPLVSPEDPLGTWLAGEPPATGTLELRAGGGAPRISVEVS